MFGPVNEIAVIVSTLLAIAIGSIWYSPLLFGSYWMKATGITAEKMEASRNKMPKMFLMAVLANGIALYIIAVFIEVSTRATVPLSVMALMLVVLPAVSVASATIWEEKSLAYFLINAGYAAVVVCMGVGVIGFWPW